MQKFKVTPDEGAEYEVQADSRDVLVWEKTNREGRTVANWGAEGGGAALGDLYAIAHAASKRQGLTELTRDQFEKTCVILVLQEGDPDPTPPAP